MLWRCVGSRESASTQVEAHLIDSPTPRQLPKKFPHRVVTPAAHTRKRDAPGCGWHPGTYGDANYFLPAALPSPESEERAAMKASCGTSTRPTIFIRFLPSFCFSSSLRLRLMSPP